SSPITYSPGSTTTVAATLPQPGQRSTVPAPAYARCAPIGCSSPQPSHTRRAVVISTAKTSCSSPATPFPSVCRSSISASSGSEAFGVDVARVVAQLDQQPRGLLDERGRAADVDVRM